MDGFTMLVYAYYSVNAGLLALVLVVLYLA
jgi:hypothetical protein